MSRPSVPPFTISHLGKVYEKIIDFLTKIEFLLAAAGLCAAMALTFCQVVNRYWLNFEIMWISVPGLFIFIFTIYVAISYGPPRRPTSPWTSARIPLRGQPGQKSYFR